MTYADATRAASQGDCSAQNNLDYLYQFLNGWILNKNGYDYGHFCKYINPKHGKCLIVFSQSQELLKTMIAEECTRDLGLDLMSTCSIRVFLWWLSLTVYTGVCIGQCETSRSQLVLGKPDMASHSALVDDVSRMVASRASNLSIIIGMEECLLKRLPHKRNYRLKTHAVILAVCEKAIRRLHIMQFKASPTLLNTSLLIWIRLYLFDTDR